MVDYLGWAATAVVVGSYFCKSPNAMRRIQMIGAVMWMGYALVTHAAPVFVANLLVLCAAAWTATRALQAGQFSGQPQSNGIRGEYENHSPAQPVQHLARVHGDVRFP
jgi:hypothetical protein